MIPIEKMAFRADTDRAKCETRIVGKLDFNYMAVLDEFAIRAAKFDSLKMMEENMRRTLWNLAYGDLHEPLCRLRMEVMQTHNSGPESARAIDALFAELFGLLRMPNPKPNKNSKGWATTVMGIMPPREVLAAERIVREWIETHGHPNQWELGGSCSRDYARRLSAAEALLRKAIDSGSMDGIITNEMKQFLNAA